MKETIGLFVVYSSLRILRFSLSTLDFRLSTKKPTLAIMLKKDYFTAILEQLARAVRNLLKMDYEKESETFIMEADRIFEDTFGVKIEDFGNKSSDVLDNFLNSDADKKPVTLLLLKTAIAFHKSDPIKGQKIYTEALQKLILANRTFSYIKSGDEMEIEQLLSIANNLYK